MADCRGPVRHLPASLPAKDGMRLRWDPRICTPLTCVSLKKSTGMWAVDLKPLHFPSQVLDLGQESARRVLGTVDLRSGRTGRSFTKRRGRAADRLQHPRVNPPSSRPGCWRSRSPVSGTRPRVSTGCTLRRFYASVLLDAGENVKALGIYLGHGEPASRTSCRVARGGAGRPWTGCTKPRILRRTAHRRPRASETTQGQRLSAAGPECGSDPGRPSDLPLQDGEVLAEFEGRDL